LQLAFHQQTSRARSAEDVERDFTALFKSEGPAARDVRTEPSIERSSHTDVFAPECTRGAHGFGVSSFTNK
jgi:hypothetical protein